MVRHYQEIERNRNYWTCETTPEWYHLQIHHSLVVYLTEVWPKTYHKRVLTSIHKNRFFVFVFLCFFTAQEGKSHVMSSPMYYDYTYRITTSTIGTSIPITRQTTQGGDSSRTKGEIFTINKPPFMKLRYVYRINRCLKVIV